MMSPAGNIEIQLIHEANTAPADRELVEAHIDKLLDANPPPCVAVRAEVHTYSLHDDPITPDGNAISGVVLEYYSAGGLDPVEVHRYTMKDFGGL
ncbi:MAG: hypothetical protein ABH879_00750 [archaeon]